MAGWQLTMTVGLTSPLLENAGFRHAFFTRNADLERASAELQISAERFFHLKQVHGTDAHVIEPADDVSAVRRVEGDITLSVHAGVGCAVQTADCPAVLIADPASGAVAAVHSGWRGTVKGAVVAGIEALRSQVGRSTELIAAVGPHIEQCCFEVGEEVANEIGEAAAVYDQALYEAIIDRSKPKPHVDLRRVLGAQLRHCGVAAIDQVAGCTMCDSVRFHSYRRDGPNSGRMLAAIVARAADMRA